MQRREVLFAVCVVVALAAITEGMEFSGALVGSSVQMAEVNAMVDLFNGANDSEIPRLQVALGAELRGSLQLFPWLSPQVGLRVQRASSGADRETVSASFVAITLGNQTELGPWHWKLDVGLMRSAFSFPASLYESLTGWSVGLTTSAGYSFRLGQRLSAEAALRFQWAPVNRMHDTEGATYQARHGPLLSFTGFGLLIEIHLLNQEPK